MQRAVSRTNCIDCLDRTNVVQSVLGRFVLEHQLYLKDIIPVGSPLPPNLDVIFKSIWTDNANTISLRYTGAFAMKTDFTRTVQRGITGKLRDGITAAERYVEQTLRDPAKQDAINLFLKKYASVCIPPLITDTKDEILLRFNAKKLSTWKQSE